MTSAKRYVPWWRRLESGVEFHSLLKRGFGALRTELFDASLCYDTKVMKQLSLIFLSIFAAEIGDKTQLATMLFATDKGLGKLGVFLAAAGALVASTLLAVVAGDLVSRVISASTLKMIAGSGFILVGIWTLISATQ